MFLQDDTRADALWEHRETPNPYPLQCGWCEEEIEDDDGGEWATRYQLTLCNECLRGLQADS